MDSTLQNHKIGSVRHAEKRRTGTCQFADRVALLSIQAYKERIPEKWRRENKQICLATIVAHSYVNEEAGGKLQVLGLGVGTKFVSDEIIEADRNLLSQGKNNENNADKLEREAKECCNYYGMRIRDSHAEVLARRAFRRKLTLEMKYLIAGKSSSGSGILQYDALAKCGKFSLADGVTIHMYTSSTPCGNSCLKKFVKMSKEKFNDCLGADEWPKEAHVPIAAHSLHLGHFALLVKKDCTSNQGSNLDDVLDHIPKKQRKWLANVSDDWCPPGTTVPHLGKGSIHTCSDKICRWNYLGLQGSLLSSLLETPIYMHSLTVGRKFTKVIAQRAVCCRASCSDAKSSKRKRGKAEDDDDGNVSEGTSEELSVYELNHPAICGTAVYLDDAGVLDMSGDKTVGQDVRFLSALCWIWCPDNDTDERYNAECIDGETGFVHPCIEADAHQQKDWKNIQKSSSSCTYELTTQFLDLVRSHGEAETIQTLDQLRSLKRAVSSNHETVKDDLLQNHRVFYQWNRRDKNCN